MTQDRMPGDGPRDEGADAFDDLFGTPSEPATTDAPEADDDGPATVTMSGAGAPPSRNAPPTHAQSDDDSVTQVIRRDQLPAAGAGAAVSGREPDPDVDSVPTGWWSTDPVTSQQDAQTPYQQTAYQGYAPPPEPPAGSYAAPQPPGGGRRGLGPLAMLALLVGGVLVGALVMLGATRLLGGDDTAGDRTTSTSSTAQPTQSSPGTSSRSSSPSATQVERKGELPAGATACGEAKQGTAVARGTEVTSCPFAGAVRDAYLSKDPKGADVNLEVRSPVTGDTYTMRCTGSTVTVCTGGNNAVVYLY